MLGVLVWRWKWILPWVRLFSSLGNIFYYFGNRTPRLWRRRMSKPGTCLSLRCMCSWGSRQRPVNIYSYGGTRWIFRILNEWTQLGRNWNWYVTNYLYFLFSFLIVFSSREEFRWSCQGCFFNNNSYFCHLRNCNPNQFFWNTTLGTIKFAV